MPYKDIEWKTITTENFYIHYPSQYESIALKTANYAQEAHVFLVPNYIGYTPGFKVHIVVSDNTDFANGSASISPVPNNFIYLALPRLNDETGEYSSRLRSVLFHELIHAYQLGYTAFYPLYYPSVHLPLDILEGYTTYFQTKYSDMRYYRSYAQILTRSLVMENRFDFSLANVRYGSRKSWPYGKLPYLAGFYLINEIATQYGEHSLGTILVDHGKRLHIFPNISTKKLFNTTYEDIWEKAKERVNAQHRVPSATTNFLTIANLDKTIDCFAISQDSKYIAYVISQSPRSLSQLILLNLETKQSQVIDTFPFEATGLTFTENKILYCKVDKSVNSYIYTSLYSYDTQTKVITNLKMRRLLEPHYSKGYIACIENSALSNTLLYIDEKNLQPKVLVKADTEEAISYPYIYGDSVLYNKTSRNGRISLHIYNLQTAKEQDLGIDNIINPIFIDDSSILGIIVSKDRRELCIANIITREVKRVTNLTGGLLSIAYAAHTQDTYAIYLHGNGTSIIKFGKNNLGNFPVEKRPVSSSKSFENFKAKINKIDRYTPWSTLTPHEVWPTFAFYHYDDPDIKDWHLFLGITLQGDDILNTVAYKVDLLYNHYLAYILYDLGFSYYLKGNRLKLRSFNTIVDNTKEFVYLYYLLGVFSYTILENIHQKCYLDLGANLLHDRYGDDITSAGPTASFSYDNTIKLYDCLKPYKGGSINLSYSSFYSRFLSYKNSIILNASYYIPVYNTQTLNFSGFLYYSNLGYGDALFIERLNTFRFLDASTFTGTRSIISAEYIAPIMQIYQGRSDFPLFAENLYFIAGVSYISKKETDKELKSIARLSTSLALKGTLLAPITLKAGVYVDLGDTEKYYGKKKDNWGIILDIGLK